MTCKGLFLITIFIVTVTSTVGAKFERKLLQSIDNGGDIRVHFGNGNKRLMKANRAMGSHSDATDKSKVDVLSGIFRNSVQQIRSKTKRIDVVYVLYIIKHCNGIPIRT